MIGLKISSNAGAMADEFAALGGEISASVRARYAPGNWAALVKTRAEATLMAIAENDRERQSVPLYVTEVAVRGLKAGMAGMEWTMTRPEAPGSEVAQMVRDFYLGELFQSGQAVDWNSLRELVTEWAETEKRENPFEVRHPGEAASHVSAILFNTGMTPARQEAIGKLLPHIVEFAEQRAAAKFGLTVARNNVWMRAVLETWVELIMET